MAGKYTYDDFEAALAASGLGSAFSDADLRLAAANPDAGMSILNSKIGYNRATTDEGRAQYNTQAENVRREYGGYTGGTDGSLYQLEPSSPKSYSGSYGDTMQSLLNDQLTYGSFSDTTAKPVYTNRYDSQIRSALDRVVNPEGFSYNAADDAIYGQYAKAYTREGERAAADALGQASAATGGLPSSYAATAAAQARNYYAAQLADKIPELADLAYDRYLNDYAMKQSALEALQNAEQSEYAKYLDELAQYNTDRDFSYNAYLDEYNRLANDLATVQAMEQDDYARYLDEIEYQSGRRSEAADAAQTVLENRYLAAQMGADVGDYSGYGALGYDTSYAEQAAALGLAEQQAALAQSEAEWQLEYALAAAELGDASYLAQMGIVPSSSETATAAGSSVEDSAKYMNFILGYWDEPGVREYIKRVTGLEPERYAEYLNATEEGANITYKGNATTEEELAKIPQIGIPTASQAYNGLTSFRNYLAANELN